VAHSNHAQECPDFGDILTEAPLGDFVNILGIRELTLWCAVVSHRNYFFCAEGQLISAEGASAILDVLDDVVEVLKVFSDKVVHSWMVGYVFSSTVSEAVLACWAADQDVIDVRYCSVGYFGLQNMGNVIMKNRNRVSPAHRQGNKVKQSEWGLKCGEVAQCTQQAALIIADIEVKHTTTGAFCKVFTDLVGEGGYSHMLDHYLIECL